MKRRISPAIIIAGTALFFALAGGAAAVTALPRRVGRPSPAARRGRSGKTT